MLMLIFSLFSESVRLLQVHCCSCCHYQHFVFELILTHCLSVIISILKLSKLPRTVPFYPVLLTEEEDFEPVSSQS